jgi:hypothetical protein
VIWNAEFLSAELTFIAGLNNPKPGCGMFLCSDIAVRERAQWVYPVGNRAIETVIIIVDKYPP